VAVSITIRKQQYSSHSIEIIKKQSRRPEVGGLHAHLLEEQEGSGRGRQPKAHQRARNNQKLRGGEGGMAAAVYVCM